MAKQREFFTISTDRLTAIADAAKMPPEVAQTYLLADWPEAEIGHDGDLTDSGDRTLCWADEPSSINDDGARAVASIRLA